MEPLLNRARTVMSRLWSASAPLTAAGLLMLGVLVISLVGLVVDPRIVTGAPVWLKPAKFAISTAIYMLTLAWVFTLLPEWPRTRRVVGWLTAVVMVLEVAIIDVQAWRGTTSHFNVGTILDGVLFTIMGLAIVVQTVTSIAVAVALWRQRFDDRAAGLGASLRDDHHHHRCLHRRPDDADRRRHSSKRCAPPVAWRSSAPTRSAHRMAAAACPARDGAWSTAISAFRTSSDSTRSRCCRCSRS